MSSWCWGQGTGSATELLIRRLTGEADRSLNSAKKRAGLQKRSRGGRTWHQQGNERDVTLTRRIVVDHDELASIHRAFAL